MIYFVCTNFTKISPKCVFAQKCERKLRNYRMGQCGSKCHPKLYLNCIPSNFLDHSPHEKTACPEILFRFGAEQLHNTKKYKLLRKV